MLLKNKKFLILLKNDKYSSTVELVGENGILKKE